MGDKFKWVKLFVENPKVIIGLYVAFSSATGISTYFNIEKSDIIISMDDKLTELSEKMSETHAPTQKQAIIRYKTDSNEVIKLIRVELTNHRREFH